MQVVLSHFDAEDDDQELTMDAVVKEVCSATLQPLAWQLVGWHGATVVSSPQIAMSRKVVGGPHEWEALMSGRPS